MPIERPSERVHNFNIRVVHSIQIRATPYNEPEQNMKFELALDDDAPEGFKYYFQSTREDGRKFQSLYDKKTYNKLESWFNEHKANPSVATKIRDWYEDPNTLSLPSPQDAWKFQNARADGKRFSLDDYIDIIIGVVILLLVLSFVFRKKP